MDFFPATPKPVNPTLPSAPTKERKRPRGRPPTALRRLPFEILHFDASTATRRHRCYETVRFDAAPARTYVPLEKKSCFQKLMDEVPLPVVILILNLRDSCVAGAIWVLYLSFYLKGESVISLSANVLNYLQSGFLHSFSWETFSFFSASSKEYIIFRSLFTDTFADAFEKIICPTEIIEAEKNFLSLENKTTLVEEISRLATSAKTMMVAPARIGTQEQEQMTRETMSLLGDLDCVRRRLYRHVLRYRESPVLESVFRFPFKSSSLSSASSLETWLKKTRLPVTIDDNLNYKCHFPMLVRCTNDTCVITKTCDSVKLTWYDFLTRGNLRESFIAVFGMHGTVPNVYTVEATNAAPPQCWVCNQPWHAEVKEKFEKNGAFEQWKRNIQEIERDFPYVEEASEDTDDDYSSDCCECEDDED